FSHSERMRRFIVYVVNETLAGRARTLKEYAVGLNVYDKPSSFDPRVDSVIRVEARRLRKKLQKYYAGEGSQDAVLIRLLPNSYVPDFQKRIGPSSTTAETSNNELHCLVLKARHFLNRSDPEGVAAAIRSFTTAANTKPGFSMGMAGLAECYTTLAW